MIKFVKGNLLESDAEALVNTVNCVGIMGKGIALQFKQAFPENFKAYQKICRQNKLQPGQMFIYKNSSLMNPKYIINFPTKKHWKEKSKIEYIQDGLESLIQEIKSLEIKSIAVPPLGCGNGGLKWEDVKLLMKEAFKQVPNVHVIIYSPSGYPQPEKMIIRTDKPRLTKARALFIALMNEYKNPGYKLTLIEIQKLAYFLQEVGEPLNLHFEQRKYGPYAENLNHVLMRLEGHYLRGLGYGKRNPDVEIYPLPCATKEAMQFLKREPSSLERLELVKKLIRGFESPYGMELLSTVHWVLKKNKEIDTLDKLVKKVHEWNDRKRSTFIEKHIDIAWNHLKSIGLY
ncbi:macro domain-containing protein [Thermoflavimicrobium daqui]|uniref:Appr-1-p processing protein n=1 Tax=Thermoflavimicrobium daqui TaxID=2137476 RepID=A0A364K5W6_9BACL|nr:macro domain-containing protein [Thermoflavimicrobium daqui]RAL25701.1 Appr-1-p processing protein [Thermoflavimicrobium daqui]